LRIFIKDKLGKFFQESALYQFFPDEEQYDKNNKIDPANNKETSAQTSNGASNPQGKTNGNEPQKEHEDASHDEQFCQQGKTLHELFEEVQFVILDRTIEIGF